MLKKILTILKRTIITLLIIGLLLFLNEMIFRIVNGPPNPNSRIVQNNGALLFTPNALLEEKTDEFQYQATFNNFGYRGKNFSVIKKEQRARILLLGDGMVFGVGLQNNETIPAQLEQILEEQGQHVDVINAGIDDSSTITHYVNLRDIHLQYNPDMVVLFFDPTDINDDWRLQRHAIFDDTGRIMHFDTTTIKGQKSWWQQLLRYSSSALAFDQSILQTYEYMKIFGRQRYQALKKNTTPLATVIATSEDMPDEIINAYDPFLLLRGRKREKLIRQNFIITEKYLNQIHSLLTEKGIRLVIATVPSGIYVSENAWGQGRLEWGFELGRVYSDYLPFTLIGEFASKKDIPFINTLPGFLKNRDQKLFFDSAPYLTPAGATIAARQLSKKGTFRKILQGILKEKKKQ